MARLARLWHKVSRNRVVFGFLISFLVTAVLLPVGRNIALVELAENYLSDVRVVLMSRPRPQSSIISIVLIDEKSLEGYPYRSPLDRSLIAGLLTRVQELGAAAIGLNVLFDRPTEPEKDELLYKLLHDMNVPVVLSRVASIAGYSASQVEYSRRFGEGLPSGLSLIFRDTVDNTIRRSMIRFIQGRRVNLGFAATLADEIGLDLPDQETLYIDYRPGPDPWTPAFPTYAAHEVAGLPEGIFANRIVLIGSDLGDDSGMRTPLAVINRGPVRNLSGTAIEAHVLSQLIEGRSISHALPLDRLLSVWLMAAFGCLAALAQLRVWLKTTISLLLIPVSWVGAFLIYMESGKMLPMVLPTFAFVGALIIASIWQWRQEFQQRRRVHRAFGRYLAPAVVQQILDNPEQLELKGEMREVTFLFTDLEGFTRLTEHTPPQDMVRLLNAYLEEACDIVIAHGGTIDKIVGDALHVMFNAPILQEDHPQRAVECALELDAWSEAFRARMREEGIELGITRIGVNTGECVVGNFGGSRRFDYTAHGDAINTTARLEAVNQRLGTRICVSEATASRCHGIYFRPVANLVLYGKEQGTVALTPIAQRDLDENLHERYAEAYRLLEAHDPRSGEILAELAELYPDDTLVRLHLERIDRLDEVDTRLAIRRK